jgi:hypothetical protein
MSSRKSDSKRRSRKGKRKSDSRAFPYDEWKFRQKEKGMLNVNTLNEAIEVFERDAQGTYQYLQKIENELNEYRNKKRVQEEEYLVSTIDKTLKIINNYRKQIKDHLRYKRFDELITTITNMERDLNVNLFYIDSNLLEKTIQVRKKKIQKAQEQINELDNLKLRGELSSDDEQKVEELKERKNEYVQSLAELEVELEAIKKRRDIFT